MQSDDWRVIIAPSGALSGYLWKFRVSEEVSVLPSLRSLRHFFGVCMGHHICVFTGGKREIPSLFDYQLTVSTLDSSFARRSSYFFVKKTSTVDV